MALRPGYVQGLLGMVAGFGIAILPPGQVGQVNVRHRFLAPLTKLPVQVQGALEMGARVLVGAEQAMRVTELAADAGLRAQVAKTVRRGQRDLVGGGVGLPVPAAGEEIGQAPGKLPGVGVEAGLGGDGDGREQDRVLGL